MRFGPLDTSAAPARDPVRPLRVALVTETYPPEVNGVAGTVARVVAGLRDAGHAVQVIRPRQGAADRGAEGELLTGGLPIPWYPELRAGFPGRRALRESWQAARPDVVHLATEGPLGWSALRVARSLGLPVVSEFRTNFHAYTRYYGMAALHRPIRAYLRWFHNRTDCTMVPTAALGRDLASAGFRDLAVVARGVDTRQFHPARRSEELRRLWGAGPDTLVALAVGRLAPEKNLDLLRETFATLRRAQPQMKAVVVGDGPARATLRRQCPEAHFAGTRRGNDLATHYASADLLLFPSVTETFGNVTLEAMASGLAVLAFDYAAAAECVRHGESGLLAPYNDSPRYLHLAASAAGRLAEIRAWGAVARRTAEGLDWGRIVDQIAGHHRAAMAKGQPADPTPDVSPQPVDPAAPFGVRRQDSVFPAP
ncbi:MAG: glycosyltransferase family 1 protein [Verrucomicrobiae bacterium]|nr:glycosyltransferase family 1 protein [Verrucomicrobiae bacterium]